MRHWGPKPCVFIHLSLLPSEETPRSQTACLSRGCGVTGPVRVHQPDGRMALGLFDKDLSPHSQLPGLGRWLSSLPLQ